YPSTIQAERHYPQQGQFGKPTSIIKIGTGLPSVFDGIYPVAMMTFRSRNPFYGWLIRLPQGFGEYLRKTITAIGDNNSFIAYVHGTSPSEFIIGWQIWIPIRF